MRVAGGEGDGAGVAGRDVAEGVEGGEGEAAGAARGRRAGGGQSEVGGGARGVGDGGAVPLAATEAGAAETVELVASTAPEVKLTAAVWLTVMESVVSVAV